MSLSSTYDQKGDYKKQWLTKLPYERHDYEKLTMTHVLRLSRGNTHKATLWLIGLIHILISAGVSASLLNFYF